MIDLLLDGIRCIFALIDQMVVFVITWLYQLIVAIADTNVFGDLIYHYLSRIYTFLGIFMVFKLSITMVNYIINPDALTDKGKGFGKLISNVIISLILLVVTPNLFKVAFQIQTDILKTNAVYQIVTGHKKDYSEGGLYENAKKSGKLIAYNVYSAFVYYQDPDDETADVENPICDPDDVEEGCKSNGRCDDDPYCLLDCDTVTEDDNTYWFILSTGVGLVVAYVFLTICFDVALRSVKLGFLQIIAPIPIMLKMDPGAKDDKFSKWLKEVSSTFLGLFIRLAAVFFAVDLITLILKHREQYGMMESYSNTDLGGVTKVFVNLFIIIGCLMFAKKLPQLLSDLFGIKLDGGGFSLKKKMGDIPGMGAAKALGAGALGFAGGMAANSLGASKTWKNTQGNWAKKLAATGGSIFAGGTSAMFRGMTSKDKNMFKAAGSGIRGAVDKRELRDKRQDAGYGFFARTADKVRGWAGVDQSTKGSILDYENRIRNLNLSESAIGQQMGDLAIKHNLNQATLSGVFEENGSYFRNDESGQKVSYTFTQGKEQEEKQYINLQQQRNAIGKEAYDLSKKVTTLKNEQQKNSK